MILAFITSMGHHTSDSYTWRNIACPRKNSILVFFSDQTSSICKCNWLLSRILIACYSYSTSCTDGPSRDRVFFANLLAKNSSVSSLLAGQWHWWIGLDFSNGIKKILILYTAILTMKSWRAFSTSCKCNSNLNLWTTFRKSNTRTFC